jgi:hypothetical protein
MTSSVVTGERFATGLTYPEYMARIAEGAGMELRIRELLASVCR